METLLPGRLDHSNLFWQFCRTRTQPANHRTDMIFKVDESPPADVSAILTSD